jgi:hypothetical protein
MNVSCEKIVFRRVHPLRGDDGWPRIVGEGVLFRQLLEIVYSEEIEEKSCSLCSALVCAPKGFYGELREGRGSRGLFAAGEIVFGEEIVG